MDSTPSLAKLLILGGGLLLAAGLAVYFLGDKLSWLGRLPGDIRFERENFRFYFPIATMILLSLLLTIVINLVRRFL
ncbi:MAG: DUF2905 domain-containing protein [Phaeodactylibacter sp.]|nr:DUF2905 domain-containing protein [Phaeodactylibacter sp.]